MAKRALTGELPGTLPGPQQMDDEQKIKYYTASQWQLVWWRFRRNRLALIGAGMLGIFIIIMVFAEFIAPYSGTTIDTNYLLGPPQIVRFWDENGFSFRPFVYSVKTTRDPVTLRMLLVMDTSQRRYIRFFERSGRYKYWGLNLIKSDLHLFGVDQGKIHLFGTDRMGRDLFSRIMLATRTSLTIGIVGVLISFFIGLFMGGEIGRAHV